MVLFQNKKKMEVSNKNEMKVPTKTMVPLDLATTILSSVAKICEDNHNFRNELIKSCQFKEKDGKIKLANFLNIDIRTIYHILDKEEQHEKSHIQSEESLSKKDHAKKYLEKEVFSHNKFYNKTFFPISTMFKRYNEKFKNIKDKAGINLFKQVWKEMHITLSPKNRCDLYSCPKCRRSEDNKNLMEQIALILEQYIKGEIKTFPVNDKHIIKAFDIKNFDLSQYQATQPNEKNENAEDKDKELWKKLTEIYEELKLHIEMRHHQREEKEKYVELALNSDNYIAIIMDFCKFYLNYKNNHAVHVLVMACYTKDKDLEYKCFVMPETKESKVEHKKINFIAQSFKYLCTKIYPNIQKGYKVAIWTDTCRGEFVNSYLLSFYSSFQFDDKGNKLFEIIVNTFEPLHGHSEADGWAGSASRHIEQKVQTLTATDNYDKEKVICFVKEITETQVIEIQKIGDIVSWVKPITGVTFARSFLFSAKNKVTLRHKTNIAGPPPKLLKEGEDAKKDKVYEFELLSNEKIQKKKEQDIKNKEKRKRKEKDNSKCKKSKQEIHRLCQAKTKENKQCTHKAKENSLFCGIKSHQQSIIKSFSVN